MSERPCGPCPATPAIVVDVGCAGEDARLEVVPGHVDAARALGMAAFVHTGTAQTHARTGEFAVGPGS
ncbi:hypothetical protein ACFV4G_17670 [Kitasatospora sp. NPDC059747]|uniref:hypothetical protein n=1 Tax=Kitasatospora sp. NPDC059747 TaxID=3346930 RepID=UPI003648E28B